MSYDTYKYPSSFVNSSHQNESVKLYYEASTTGTVQEVEGEIEKPSRANYVVVKTGDERYRVADSGRKNRSSGDVIRNGRKVGEFIKAERTRELKKITIYGHAYKSIKVDKEEWEEMSEEERKQVCYDSWKDVTPSEPTSYDDGGGDRNHW